MTNDKDFADLAKQGSSGAVAEFWYFLRHNKKWWLVPLVLVILIVAGLAIFSGSPVAPFIYTLF